jgi:protocatechuate 3,4-dioxygenase alpha subunit
MTTSTKPIPTSSQTVGPYFRIGLQYMLDRCDAVGAATAGSIEIRGRVLDSDGAGVSDAMLEFWTPGAAETLPPSTQDRDGLPRGFCRVGTDKDGSFTAKMKKPVAVALGDGRMQAPHMLVLVFMRGLLRNLLSRVYFADEPGNAADPVLGEIPAERSGTLIAQLENHESSSYRWNVVLQGSDETVFFEW